MFPTKIKHTDPTGGGTRQLHVPLTDGVRHACLRNRTHLFVASETDLRILGRLVVGVAVVVEVWPTVGGASSGRKVHENEKGPADERSPQGQTFPYLKQMD